MDMKVNKIKILINEFFCFVSKKKQKTINKNRCAAATLKCPLYSFVSRYCCETVKETHRYVPRHSYAPNIPGKTPSIASRLRRGLGYVLWILLF